MIAAPSLKTEVKIGHAPILWLLIAVYAAARFLQVWPVGPALTVVVLHVLPPAIFALMHGAAQYRLRGIMIFTALCLMTGFIFEFIGVNTGFPFGHYYFTDVMGPKLLQVPVLLALAYLGMGYLSWVLASLILGYAQSHAQRRLAGIHVVAMPLAASFIMVAWDLSMDPAWSTVLHAWIWQQGGAYLGVPISNFLGWFLTVYIFYQLFALYLWRGAIMPAPLPRSYLRSAVVFYGISAAGNLLLLLSKGPPVVADAAGSQWKLTDITGVCALVTIFTMGAFTLLAWVRNEAGEP